MKEVGLPFALDAGGGEVDGGGGTEYARSLAVGLHSRASAGFPALLRSLGAK
jgi:hypothetical protein